MRAAVFAALIVMTGGMFGDDTASAAPRGSPWGAGYFPNLPLVTHTGQTVRFYEDLIKGKIVVINFIYTSCQDNCPLITARLAQVVTRLGPRVGRDIFIYSITLDPERDTPAVLKRYADTFHVGAGWLFLTGRREDIDLIRHKLGERSRRLADHRNDAVLGNDKTGEWTRTSIFSDLDRMAITILDLDPDWRVRKRSKGVKGYADAPLLRLPQQPGQALFVKACAPCHTIGKGELVGPDLKGVTARRDRDWLVRFMMAPGSMRARKDPIAVELYERYNKGVSMPNLGLSETDAADLISYLEAHGMDPQGPEGKVSTP